MTDDPLVLPLRPSVGWHRADLTSRVASLLAVLMLATWPLALLVDAERGAALVSLTALVLGPPCFYSLARVLRPHPIRYTERAGRHVIAAMATSYGTAILYDLWLGDDGVTAYLLGLPAFVGLAITVPWGVIALVVRATRTPVPAQRM